jgi:hypothetical protein
MTINYKSYRFIASLLLVYLLICSSSNAIQNEWNGSESMYEENILLPDYGPGMFEIAKNETGFIVAKGEMPVINQEEEKRKWLNSLENCSLSLVNYNSDKNTGLRKYFADQGGPIESFGGHMNGYLKVGFESTTPEKVNESTIDDIYELIKKHCEESGINNVPVVFMWEHEVVDVGVESPAPDSDMITIMDENGNYITVNESDVYIDEDGNYVLKTNEMGEDESESNAQKVSGFNSIMLLIVLFLLIGIRK